MSRGATGYTVTSGGGNPIYMHAQMQIESEQNIDCKQYSVNSRYTEMEALVIRELLAVTFGNMETTIAEQL